MKNIQKVSICSIAAFLFFTAVMAQQPNKENYFSISSPKDIADKNYGSVTVTATKSATIISTIMAYGENVRGLTIEFNNGYSFKLAPAPTVLQPELYWQFIMHCIAAWRKCKDRF